MGHWYNPDGSGERADSPRADWLPSVSTILKATRSTEFNELLGNAALMDPYGFSERSEFGRDRGLQLHAWIEAFILDVPLPLVSPQFQPWMHAVLPHLRKLRERYPRIVAIEQPVYGQNFAGTPDLVLWMEAGNLVVDFKFCSRPMTGLILDEAYTQVAGYADAVGQVSACLVLAVQAGHVAQRYFSPLSYMAHWRARLKSYHAYGWKG